MNISYDRPIPKYMKKYGKYFKFDGRVGTVIQNDTPKEAIKLYLRDIADMQLGCDELGSAEALIKFMTNKLKETDYFKQKSEEEQNELIEYISKDPQPEKTVIYDENGKEMKLKGLRIYK